MISKCLFFIVQKVMDEKNNNKTLLQKKYTAMFDKFLHCDKKLTNMKGNFCICSAHGVRKQT